MNKYLYLILGVILLFASNTYAQAPKYSNEFLQIGVGARSMGMGNATVASVNDVTASYWNPAGLLGIQNKSELSVMHAEYFAGIAKYDYVGFSRKFKDSSALGISYIRFGVDDIQNTLFLYGESGTGTPNYDNITTFSVSDNAFLLSYARHLGVKNLYFGGNFKIIHRKVGSFARAWGFGLDVGVQYKYKGWQFGLSAKDITSTFNAWSYSFTDAEKDVLDVTGNEIPENGLEITLPSFVLGAAKNFKFKKGFSLLTELDFVSTVDGKRNTLVSSKVISIDPRLGVELAYRFGKANGVFFRMGVGNFQKQKNFEGEEFLTVQPNLGIGLKLKFFHLNYAFTDIGDVSIAMYSNVFSIKFDINSLKLGKK